MELDVISPGVLPSGYVLWVEYAGDTLEGPQQVRPVIVPDPGVLAGQIFRVAIPIQDDDDTADSSTSATAAVVSRNHHDTNTDPAPLPCTVSPATTAEAVAVLAETAAGTAGGVWKAGLFDCLSSGIGPTILWQAWCCPHMLMTQIMRRVGNHASHLHHGYTPMIPASASAATTMTMTSWSKWYDSVLRYLPFALMLVVVLSVSLHQPQQLRPYEHGATTDITWSTTAEAEANAATPNGTFVDTTSSGIMSSWMLLTPRLSEILIWYEFLYGCCSIPCSIITCYILIKLRSTVRAEHGIAPHRLLGPAEDCCCVFWCHCCTLAQLARQTAADDDQDKEGKGYQDLRGSCQKSACCLDRTGSRTAGSIRTAVRDAVQKFCIAD